MIRRYIKKIPGAIKLYRWVCRLNYKGTNKDCSSFYSDSIKLKSHSRYIDIDLEVNIPWDETRNYQYSKLYYVASTDKDFTESQVLCFRIQKNRTRHTVRIKIPDSFTFVGLCDFRVDLFPCAKADGKIFQLKKVVNKNEKHDLTEAADIQELKRIARAEVLLSEQKQRVKLPHYPESLSLELQPGCNLQCSHCATHGEQTAHQLNNRLGSISQAKLQALSKELFPHLTLLHMVGRGEPLMVSDELWNNLVTEASKSLLLATVVTNGYFVKRRINEQSLPLFDTLTFSVDGFSQHVFASNRGGADLHVVLDAIRYYHELRKKICLPRRPKLCLSWTLKKNNIAELPAFVEYMARFEPDRYYIRHLLVCHDKDEEQSLLKIPEIANKYLSQAYKLMASQGVETDCPPLIKDVKANDKSAAKQSEIKSASIPVKQTQPLVKPVPPKNSPAQTSVKPTPNRDNFCHYIHRTASIKAQGNMTTCGIYHAKKVGDYDENTPFTQLWNGDVMTSVRRDINTENEWEQCKNCWYRESRYYSQREQRSKNSAYSMTNEASFSEGAWDYRNK